MLHREVAASGTGVCDRVQRQWPFSEDAQKSLPQRFSQIQTIELLINTLSLLMDLISLTVLKSFCCYINESFECWVGRAEAQSWSWFALFHLIPW